MNANDRKRLIEEVRTAANCSHPIRLNGETIDVSTGEVRKSQLRVACKDRRQVVCASCSSVYKTDAWILVSAGLIGGKGVTLDVAERDKFFVTLTAPSFGRVHTVTPSGACNPSFLAGTERCSHGESTVCRMLHPDGDTMLGTPLCANCFNYRGAVLWNAHASRLFSLTIRQTSRRVAADGGLPQLALTRVARISYLRVAEMQRRGLVHFHAILRIDGPDADRKTPPEWLTSDVLERALHASVRKIRLTCADGRPVHWGGQFRVSRLEDPNGDVNRVASYVAKYAVKTTDGSTEFAYRFTSRRQIRAITSDDHRRRLALAAWDLSSDPAYAELKLHLHAHAFGFTGQLITKSRGFTTTFGALRRARSDFMATAHGSNPVEGTFSYLGRGYDDPRAAELADLFFRMERELREERASARRSRESSSSPVPRNRS